MGRTLADLLSGCNCTSCRARDAARPQPRLLQHRPPSRMTTEQQLAFYGYAVTERVVTVH